MTDKEQSRPRLGEFTKPSTPQARQQAEDEMEAAAEAAPTEEEQEDALLDQVKGGDESVAQEAKKRMSLYAEMQDALLPVQDYKKFLKDHDISEEEAENIVDDLVTKGYYEEEFPLTRRRSVTFRTREHRDQMRLQVMFQVQQPVFQGAIDEMTVRFNIAGSLSVYCDERFSFPNAEATDKDADDLFDKRMAFVERIPGPVFTKLSMKLALFDRKIAAVMREGVAENF